MAAKSKQKDDYLVKQMNKPKIQTHGVNVKINRIIAPAKYEANKA